MGFLYFRYHDANELFGVYPGKCGVTSGGLGGQNHRAHYFLPKQVTILLPQLPVLWPINSMPRRFNTFASLILPYFRIPPICSISPRPDYLSLEQNIVKFLFAIVPALPHSGGGNSNQSPDCNACHRLVIFPL
jgi:hypothetical protein